MASDDAFILFLGFLLFIVGPILAISLVVALIRYLWRKGSDNS